MSDLKMNKKERTLYNSWSKQQVYIAFVTEHKKNEAAQAEIKRLNEYIAGMEYENKLQS